MSDNKKNRFIVLDTETTGLFAGDRIIDLGCVEIINNEQTNNNFQRYINPEKSINSESFAIHNISNEFLKNKPLFKDIANDLLSYLDQDKEKYNNYIVAHNASFDTKFLNYEFNLIGLGAITDTFAVIDTIVLAKQALPGQSVNLDALCKHFGIDISKRTELGHGALLDASLLSQIFIIFIKNGLVDKLLNQRTNVQIVKNNTILPTRGIIYKYQEEIEMHKEFVAKYKLLFDSIES